MKKLLNVSLIVVLLSSFAESTHSAPTWHQGTITKIYPTADGAVILSFDTDHSDCQNINSPKYYLKVGENGMTQDGMKNQYSAALSAAAMGKAVTINFEAASDGCYINRLLISF